MMSMMGTGMFLMMIFWIIVVGLVIYAVLMLITKGFGRKEDSALRILRERFARGEMDEGEFEQKRGALSKK